MKTSIIALAIVILFTTSLSAQTNTAIRTWTAKDGKQIVAKLHCYEKGIVSLKSGSRVITIKDSALSDIDRAYLSTLCNPSIGISAQQVAIKLAEQYAIADPENDAKEEIAKLKAETTLLQKEVATIYEGCLTDAPYQGQTGRLQNGRAVINQIIGPTTALITYRYSKDGDNKRQVLLQGVSTKGLADDMPIFLPGQYEVDGTHTYETAVGARRTVLVLKPASSTNSVRKASSK